MRKKWERLLKYKKRAGGQSISMQKRLVLYWFVLILALFLAFLLILNILGILPGVDRKVGEMLAIQQKNTVAAVASQADMMMARSISLSEDVTRELGRMLTEEGKTFSSLNDCPEGIRELELSLYPYLKAALDVRCCSGVFVVLDATVNRSAEKADISRMGLYLRFSDLKAVNTYRQHMTFFRGVPDVARAEQIPLHNRWNLEFDTASLPGYEQILKLRGMRLVEQCFWTERMELKDTWEEVQLLYVPVLDSTGTVRGICGMELSELYFRLSYPQVKGNYGDMITVLAPVDKDGTIFLDKAMLGDTEGTYLSPKGIMAVDTGTQYNIYRTESGNYLGVQEFLELNCVDGRKLAAITLISESGYRELVEQNRKSWVVGTGSFLILLLGFSMVLSKGFVRPILESLKALQEEPGAGMEPSGISEVDALVALVQSRADQAKAKMGGLPPDMEALLREFAEKVAGLTPAEQRVLQYYIDGYTIDEIASLLCISIGTARKHNTNMNKKLGIATREELMLYIDLFRKCDQLERLTGPAK